MGRAGPETGAVLACGLAVFAAPAHADWQVDRLISPTPAQLAAEAEGRVVIYDGLDANLIGYAMDTRFERIQNMMFIRIHHLPPPGAGGEAVVEDDGCD